MITCASFLYAAYLVCDDSIAPAAKLRRYGKIGIKSPETATVMSAKIGSTAPESVPYKNPRHRPCSTPIGAERIAPSGMF